MYTVKFTTAFKKSYKLMKKRGLDLSLLETVDKLRQGIALEKDTGTMNQAETVVCTPSIGQPNN